MPFLTEGGCRDPGTPENGRKLGRMIYSVNSNVYFGCDLGYELVGSEKRKCQQKGTWTGRQPVCRGKPFFLGLEAWGPFLESPVNLPGL